MASKITQLTEDTTPTHDDLIETVTDPAGTPTNKKAKLSSLFFVFQQWVFGSDAGSSDTYVVTLSPAPTAYVTGYHYRFRANTANTGACTVNFNGLGAKTIKKAAGGITTDLANNDIRAGQWVDLVYDGTNMQMQSLLGNAPAGGVGGIGDVTGPGSSTDNAIARFDSTTGKLIQNSSMTCADDLSGEIGYINIPQFSYSDDHTAVIGERGGHLFHPVGDNNARTFTIPANGSVAFPVGTAITFVNKINVLSIAITTDTLTWAEDGTTGTRSLVSNGMATALKITTTEWLISGIGLS